MQTISRPDPRYVCDACGKDHGRLGSEGGFGPKGVLAFYDDSLDGQYLLDRCRHFCDWSCVTAFAAKIGERST